MSQWPADRDRELDALGELHPLQYFDVEAISIETGVTRKLAERKTKSDAEAIVNFAIFRRGVDEEVYAIVPHQESP